MKKSDVVSTPVTITIKAPNLRVITVRIRGTAPLMMHRFGKKAEIMQKQMAGSTARGKKMHEPRNFERDFIEAQYISQEGWNGIPASAFRAAMISACRLVGFQMTKAKLSVFVEADGISEKDATPLVRIIGGEPELSTMPCRNETGVVDIRARPLWREWEADVRIRYDADQFTMQDVLNLLARVGMQVGIGEGRPDSRKSAGLGYGTFTVVSEKSAAA